MLRNTHTAFVYTCTYRLQTQAYTPRLWGYKKIANSYKQVQYAEQQVSCVVNLKEEVPPSEHSVSLQLDFLSFH